jgi:hypothetical protein
VADIRAKAVLLTQAEADFVRLLVKLSGTNAAMWNERAGVLRKLTGLTETAPAKPTSGLHGGLRDRI